MKIHYELLAIYIFSSNLEANEKVKILEFTFLFEFRKLNV